MTPEQIETTLDQLVRRARYLDDREKWTYEDRRTWKEWKVKVEELRTAHGVVPFAEHPPAPQPASEGVRWFRISDSNEDRFHEGTTWTVYPVGGPLATKGGRTWNVHLKINEAEQQVREGYWVELDGPPPHGKPLAKPATDGDGSDVVVEALRLAISREREVIGSPASPFAVDEVLLKQYEKAITVARATASLRAEVEAQKLQAHRNLVAYDKSTRERDELRAEVERLRGAIFWACGVNGPWRDRKPGEGAFYWRKGLCSRDGIGDDEITTMANPKPTRRPAPRKGKGVRK